MKLHDNKRSFREAIELTAQDLEIYPEFVEKDYWICQILQNLSRNPAAERTVWKGGTSLSKAYGLIARFSSDVDFAILGEGLSQNQQKKLVARIGHESTAGMEEVEKPDTVKNNRFRKTYHIYKSVLDGINRGSSNVMSNQVIVEINTYGNPYPYERREIKPFITEMMERRGLNDMIADLDMKPFVLNVLDKRRTLCEKVVSLLRFSFEDDPTAGLISKIRHFYDLYFLLGDEECGDYVVGDLKQNLVELIEHDKKEFDRPPKWRDAPILSSPLIVDFDSTWRKISDVYQSELPVLSYRTIPGPNEIADSMKELIKVVVDAVR